MDGISAAAALLGVVGFGLSTMKMVLDFYNSARNRRSDINELVELTKNLLKLLENIQNILNYRGIDNEASILVVGTLRATRATLDRLAGEMHKIQLKAARRGISGIPFGLQYPFKESTILKLRKAISVDLNRNLTSAMNLLNIDTSILTHQAVLHGASETNEALSNLQQGLSGGIQDLQALVRMVQDEERQRILSWLSPSTYVTEFHQAIRQDRQLGTGKWFIEGSYYYAWMSTPASFAWLTGSAGCGKSVLASSIVDKTITICNENAGYHVAYFYFSFSSSKTQKARIMLRSLTRQLVQELSSVPDTIRDLYKKNPTDTPPDDILVDALLTIVQNLTQVYIVIDGLDECPTTNRERKKLVDLLTSIIHRRISNLHILATSRRESDLLVLADLATLDPMSLQSDEVDEDIRYYVKASLLEHPVLSQWPDHMKADIEKELLAKTSGMFQWVTCQLHDLGNCSTSLEVYQVLGTLPGTLDETYERMLLRIEERHRKYALRALKWLCFSEKVLTIAEVAEASIIDIEDEVPFDIKNRFFEPVQCAELLSGFISREYVLSEDILKQIREEVVTSGVDINPRDEIRIAHFSIKEYLTSQRVKQGLAKYFALDQVKTYEELAEASMNYIIYNEPMRRDGGPKPPLLEHASEFWFQYLRKLPTEPAQRTKNIALSLLQSEAARRTWTSAFKVTELLDDKDSRVDERPRWEPNDHDDLTWEPRATPLYYASLLGLDMLIDTLIHNGADVNFGGGYFGAPLQAAAINGHITTVDTLLDYSPQIDALSGRLGTALRAACFRGFEEIVQSLLAADADVNVFVSETEYCIPGEQNDIRDALSIVPLSKRPNLNIVLRLLARGARVTPDREITGWMMYKSATTNDLKLATEVMSRLTDLGMKTDFKWAKKVEPQLDPLPNMEQDSYQSNASPPYEAIYRGNDIVATYLLDRWSDVDQQDTEGRTAIYWACFKKNYDFVQKLLEAGADIHCEGPNGWSPRYWAESFADERLVKLLDTACAKNGKCAHCCTSVARAEDDEVFFEVSDL